MTGQTLHDKLRQQISATFVGRDDICAWFKAACASADGERVLFVYGPGGVGKTTLARRLAALASTVGRVPLQLDARSFTAAPESFIRELGRALNGKDSMEPLEALAALESPAVLFVDTFEAVAELEPWLVREFIPRLPADSIVVIVGRNKPGGIWKTEPGWDGLLRVEPLRNFSRTDTEQYLKSVEVPPKHHERVIRFSRGHPLALSLFAEIFRQRPTADFDPEENQDLIKALLDRFVQKVPSQAHRAAVESCSIVRSMTEDLLASMLDSSDVHEIFDWLRERSFVETGLDGVYPHDLARAVLSSDLKWRNATWYQQLHNRARNYYTARLEAAEPEEQESILFEYIYLHRDNPVVKPFFGSLGAGTPARSFRGVLDADDRSQLVELVEGFEGTNSAELLRRWADDQPDQFVLYKDEPGTVTGFLLQLALDRLIEAPDHPIVADDVVTKRVLDFLNDRAPLAKGERATLFRFWMARETYHQLSRMQTRLFVEMVRHYLVTPHLVYSFLPVENPDFWGAVLEYADLYRISELDFSVGERSFGMYGHDWRQTPAAAWLDLLGSREVGETKQAPRTSPASITALSKDDFADALDDALKHYAQPWKLTGNPLLLSAVVHAAMAGEAGVEERIEALQSVLSEAAAELSANPKLDKARRAIERTYLKPAGTQELAAEALDLPFSTYRRHLKKGVTELLESLWLAEISS